MIMRQHPGYEKIYTANGAGRAVYVHKAYSENFQQVLREYRNNYHMTSVFRQIVSLNADPLRGTGQNPGADMYKIRNGNIYMEYSLYGGAVMIDRFIIDLPTIDDRFGLFPVSWDEEYKRWAPAKEPVNAIDKDHQWPSKNGKAHYVAVAGRFDDKETAGHLLFDHLIGAYQKKLNFLADSNAIGPYSLFWTRKGQHKSLEAAQALASIMQQANEAGRSVNWLIHDAGTDTFKATANILKLQPLADAKARALDEKAGMIQGGQNVYFSNPNTSSIESFKSKR